MCACVCVCVVCVCVCVVCSVCNFVTVCECVHMWADGGLDDALPGKNGIWVGFPEMTEKIRKCVCINLPAPPYIR